MAIVNTDFNSNSYRIRTGREKSGSVVEINRVRRSFSDKASEISTSESNAVAAKSNVSNAGMASEVAYFSRLQAISRKSNYAAARSVNPVTVISNTSLPQFDRTI